MKQPVLVTRPFFPDRKELDRLIDEIWENQWMTNQGPLHERLRQKLCEYLGTENITLTVNGHLALEVMMRGLRIHGEVITTPYTFPSTVHAIKLCGLTPVFCDVRESDLTIDTDKIERLITEKTEAILGVHVYGHPCDVVRIEHIAEKHNLKVMYDAAHAFGVKVNNKCIGLYGDASIFSFHATKLFNTIEGGAIVYSDKKYENIFNMYKNFGIEDEESIPYVGGNAKMNEFQAAMGLANLPYMAEIINQRKEYVKRYRLRLNSISGIKYFVPEKEGIEYNYSYMPVLVEDACKKTRDELYLLLKNDQVYVRKYFYPLLSDLVVYREVRGSRDLPVAKYASSKVLSLPLFYGMGVDTVDYVCDCIEKYCT